MFCRLFLFFPAIKGHLRGNSTKGEAQLYEIQFKWNTPAPFLYVLYCLQDKLHLFD